MMRFWKTLLLWCSSRLVIKKRIDEGLRFHFYGIAIFFIGHIVLFIGCKKTESDVGIGLQPDSELLNTTSVDTFAIKTYSVKADSLLTSNLSVFPLGRINDPVFGHTTASIYTQILLSEENVDFGNVDDISIDSVVLSLDYEGSYGNIASNTFQVYQIKSEGIFPSKMECYSNSIFDTPKLIGELHNYTPNISDSVTVNGIKEPAQLRIKLEKSVGETLLNRANGRDNASFVKRYEGLYITADMSDNYMLYIHLISNFSNLKVYYSNVDEDSLNYEFNISIF